MHALKPDLRALIDDLLEITVAGSFASPGYAIRRRLFGWRDQAPDALRSRTVAITGPTSGLGRATALAVAELGARVVLIGRSEERLRALRDVLVAQHREDRFPIVVADMASLASMRVAARQILDTEPRLDVLIDNAGAIYPKRVESPDGIEATLAVLVVGPFALTAGLLQLLRAAGDGRVISVTSGGMYFQRAHLDDLEWRLEPYSGTRAYARAKRVQVALVREWGRRLAGSGVTANAMHPGWADTPGLTESLPGFARVMRPVLRTPEQGIDTLVWLASDPAAASWTGRLFLDRGPRPFDRLPVTRLSAADRRYLWDNVVDLARVPDPAPSA